LNYTRWCREFRPALLEVDVHVSESHDTNNPHIKKVRVVSIVEYYLAD
jgi:hypothetical protein